ncbi:hypothetical protein D3C71_1803680 [compost metagenome]
MVGVVAPIEFFVGHQRKYGAFNEPVDHRNEQQEEGGVVVPDRVIAERTEQADRGQQCHGPGVTATQIPPVRAQPPKQASQQPHGDLAARTSGGCGGQ